MPPEHPRSGSGIAATLRHSLAALQRHRRDGGSAIDLRIPGVKDTRCTFRAVHGRTQDQIELVDQSRAQKGTVGTAASLQQQPLHAEFAIEDVEREGEIELRPADKACRRGSAGAELGLRSRAHPGRELFAFLSPEAADHTTVVFFVL